MKQSTWYVIGGSITGVCLCGTLVTIAGGTPERPVGPPRVEWFESPRPSLTPSPTPGRVQVRVRPTAAPRRRPRPTRAPVIRTCADASGPIRRGEPGYAPHLDRDGDGVACET